MTSGQLTREAIEERKEPQGASQNGASQAQDAVGEAEEGATLHAVSKRQTSPMPLLILRNHPEFADADIIKLIGTTKATIQKIRERSHWNATNIKAVDPVTLDRVLSRA